MPVRRPHGIGAQPPRAASFCSSPTQTARRSPAGSQRSATPFADPDVAGAKGTYLSKQRSIVARFTQLEYEDRYDRMAGSDRIDFIDTYSAAYRRDIFLANGGFDSRFLINEDQEFAFRLAEKGYKLVFAPAAQVYHQHNRTLTQYIRRKFKIGMWKVRVTRQHPTQVVRDSHTPGALKAQLLLAAAGLALIVVASLAGIMLRSPWWPGLIALLAASSRFEATSLPFHRQDRSPRSRGVCCPRWCYCGRARWRSGSVLPWGCVRFRRQSTNRDPRSP